MFCLIYFRKTNNVIILTIITIALYIPSCENFHHILNVSLVCSIHSWANCFNSPSILVFSCFLERKLLFIIFTYCLYDIIWKVFHLLKVIDKNTQTNHLYRKILGSIPLSLSLFSQTHRHTHTLTQERKTIKRNNQN